MAPQHPIMNPPNPPIPKTPSAGSICTPGEWRNRIDYTSELPCEDSTPGPDTPLPSNGRSKGTLKKTKVHNFFASENFPLGPLNSARVLTEMRPSFALCTKILRHKGIAEPWIRALLGKMSPAVDSKSRATYFRDQPTNVDVAYRHVPAELKNLKVKFCFVAFNIPDEDNTKGQQIHGMHLLPHEPITHEHDFCFAVGTDISAINNMQQYHRIHINAAYYEYFAQTKAVRGRNPARELLTYFSLGVTLAHEIYHAFCSSHVVYQEGLGKKYVEPYYSLSQLQTAAEPELGVALEQKLFGTLIRSKIHPTEGAHIETSRDVEARSGGVSVKFEGRWCSLVRLDWVYAFISEEFWEKVGCCEDLHMKPPQSVIIRHRVTGKWGWKDFGETSTDEYRNGKIAELKQKDRQEVQEMLEKKLARLDAELSDEEDGNGGNGMDVDSLPEKRTRKPSKHKDGTMVELPRKRRR